MERLYSGKLESNKFVVNILTLFLFLVVISACRIQNPEPITTEMPVQISIPTITPIPSLQTKSQRAKAFNDLWNISCSESNVSPDGKWCAIDMGEDIEVFGIDGITKYQFDLTQTSKPIEICGVFFAEFWSPDHTFLYFAPGI